MNDTTPKTALITGGARRIGRAIALALGKAGWNIAVHYNGSAEDAEATAREISQIGVKAAAIRAQLENQEELAGLIATAEDALGPVSCLVNNASVFEPDTVDNVTAESWDRHLDINLRAPLFLSQSFAERLPEGLDGNIVNIIDQRVWNPTPWFLSYTVSKAGLWTLTRTLATALAPEIRVNAIGPGPTLPSPRQEESHFQAQAEATPLGHGATPEEIGDAVCFILSASSMTGQMISLDGGQHLGWEYPGSTRCPEE